MTSMKDHYDHANNACEIGATPALTGVIELTEEELQNIAGGATLQELFHREDRPRVTFNDTPTYHSLSPSPSHSPDRSPSPSSTRSGSTLGKVGKAGGVIGGLAVIGGGIYEAAKHW